MIDHLMRYTDETTAMDALSAHTIEGIEPGVRQWDASYVFPDVKAYRILGTETVEDGMGGTYEREIRDLLPGFFVLIALPERDSLLDGDSCVLIGDRDAGTVLYTITTPADLATLYLEPMPAGSNYPFGAPIIAT